jgi:hypothetical protein
MRFRLEKGSKVFRRDDYRAFVAMIAIIKHDNAGASQDDTLFFAWRDWSHSAS